VEPRPGPPSEELSEPAPSLQERLEWSRFGRALISVFLVVTLAGATLENLPQSRLRTDALRVAQPYLNATGLEQVWGVFAPEPRRESIALRALVSYANGSTQTWRTPTSNPVIGSYWDYHWQKWQEWALDENHRQLWRPAALFIARDVDRQGRHPVRVTLLRLTSIIEPPGHRPSHGPTVAKPYYSVRITPSDLHPGGRR
jgi:hypothetical protein